MTDRDTGDGRPPDGRLSKQLGLLHVYAINTGAMTSGFFLLPGIAAGETGPSVVLAYLIAGILAVPAMLSAAELTTAMPRAGGPYYFVDRSMGPAAGTIAGLGMWLALVFKSAFALVGIGAYAGLFLDFRIEPVAVVIAVGFTVVNIVGVKKTTGLQVAFVAVMLAVLGYFVGAGISGTVGDPGVRAQFEPFLPFGLSGLAATVGLVFVSFGGLSQVASVAEEVRDPGRNIPLGMILSLLTATVIYVLGVAVMVGTVDPQIFRDNLTPAATASEAFMPQPLGLWLVVAAAFAAFASTSNAGILAAARYPFAMARDRLLTGLLARISRTGTPSPAIVLTGAVAVGAIVLLDVESIAKLASAFLLFVFGLLNLAVVIMRESRIPGYDPAFRSPLYPWLHVAGVLISVVLIIEMGALAIAFTVGTVTACTIWYVTYAAKRAERDGAIYHLFARLGQRRDAGLDDELMGVAAEQGLRAEDRFDHIVANAAVVDVEPGTRFEDALRLACEEVVRRFGASSGDAVDALLGEVNAHAMPATAGLALPHVLLDGVEHTELVVVRAAGGALAAGEDVDLPEDPGSGTLIGLCLVAGPRDHAGRVFRVLAAIAAHAEGDGLAGAWSRAGDAHAVRDALLRHERVLSIEVRDGVAERMGGRALRRLDFPRGSLVALVHRDGSTWVPAGDTVLRHGDRLTLVGDAAALEECRQRFGTEM